MPLPVSETAKPTAQPNPIDPDPGFNQYQGSDPQYLRLSLSICPDTCLHRDLQRGTHIPAGPHTILLGCLPRVAHAAEQHTHGPQSSSEPRPESGCLLYQPRQLIRGDGFRVMGWDKSEARGMATGKWKRNGVTVLSFLREDTTDWKR